MFPSYPNAGVKDLCVASPSSWVGGERWDLLLAFLSFFQSLGDLWKVAVPQVTVDRSLNLILLPVPTVGGTISRVES